MHVTRGGRDLGPIRDAVVSPSGEIEAFVVDSGGDVATVSIDPALSIDGNGRDGSG